MCERWREYCEKLYNTDLGTNENDINDAGPRNNEREPDILQSEVEKAIKSLQKNKAPGIDNIPAELLKAGGIEMVQLLTKLCTIILRTSHWPEQWTQSIVIPLPKKGNLKECGNYRTISLISHPSKILLKVILNRMQPRIVSLLSEEQAGFRKGRSTSEQIFNIRLLVEKYVEHGLCLFVNFIDFKKAFDRVWHKALWSTMRKNGFSEDITTALVNLYSHAGSCMLVAGELSPPFTPSVGVRQGCLLSPALFNMYLEEIMSEALEKFEGEVVIGGRKIDNLRFADDIALIGATTAELQDLTTKVDATARKYGMLISSEKSKIMNFEKDAINKPGPIQIGNQTLEEVKQFKYLGNTLTEDAHSNKEIQIRIARALSALSSLNILWKDRSISKRTKIMFMRSLVLSSFLYGCETWTISADSERKINSFEMRCYRRLLGVPYTAHRTNDSIIGEVRQHIGCFERFFETVKKRKLQLYGHTVRANNLATTFLQGAVPVRRPRGRPRKTWLSNVEESTKRRPRNCWH